MFPPFPQEQALKVLQTVCAGLKEGSLCLNQVTEVSTERAGNGLMIGAMVARTPDNQEVNLVTVSGIARMIASSEPDERFIFVEPIVKPSQIADALKEHDDEIHELTRKIESIGEGVAQGKDFPGACGAASDGGTAPDGGASPHEGDAAETADTSPLRQKKELEKRRTYLCSQSLQKIFALYDFACFDGKRRSLMEICAQRLGKGADGKPRLPPNGTGECCEPKLIDYAFSHGLTPVSMAEVYWGKETDSRVNGKSYPPCDERCGIILPAMLGLEILYRDESIVVVNKQSGVLSVPGRGPEKADSIASRLRHLFPDCIEQPSVHRLDMETSGILVLALTKEAHRTLSMQFERGGIEKQYVALLDGNLLERKIPSHGQSELYFRVDLDNRPHQMWDEVYGKKAVTEWNIIRVENYTAPDGTKSRATRVLFTPHTGRTHQLRLASADSHGFGVPIIGDTLYGTCSAGQRLLLHATKLSFTHPATGERMTFESCEPF